MQAITKEQILAILKSYEKEMEGYGYFSSNPGVSTDDFEDIADEILKKISEKDS
jgi:hypothetical protein